MTVIINKDKNLCTLKFSGKLNYEEVNHHYDEFKKVIDEDFKEVIFDYSDVNFIDSSGIRLLVEYYRIKNEAVKVKLNKTVYEAFAFLGLEEIFQEVS